jgi:hypothetical protein
MRNQRRRRPGPDYYVMSRSARVVRTNIALTAALTSKNALLIAAIVPLLARSARR